MIYPKNFEHKVEFDKIREMLYARCLSPLGKSIVAQMTMTERASEINGKLEQIRQLRKLQEENADFAIGPFSDIREPMKRIRMEGTFLEAGELWNLKKTLSTIAELTRWFKQSSPLPFPHHQEEETASEENGIRPETVSPPSPADDEKDGKQFPALDALTEGVITFPTLIQRIDQVLDPFGNIRDTASPELQRIRSELAHTKGSISGILNNILLSAHQNGFIEKDVAPTIRDGRLMIPVAPGMKRKIQGIIHDESDSGRTVFIEPAEVVEANNRIRELQSDERHEIVRILKELSKHVRPHVMEILYGVQFLAQVDFIQAKVRLAQTFRATEPEVLNMPIIDWWHAKHPLLEMRLRKETPLSCSAVPEEGGASAGRAGFVSSRTDTTDGQPTGVVPLDISLTTDLRILVISGPNAGGKSVCLKTVGLLQYMLQCGLSIPVGEHSKCGVFKNLMIDIGDEQSIDDDLSTYSSHLMNMKAMMRLADNHSLILIDEFGTGTEPQIGGAIAESVLEQFCKRHSWAVITTHYKNLKDFASSHKDVANGAMLYDRKEMRPLFRLSIGNPGSSFAIDIAKKIGLPEDVIRRASEIVGTDYIQSDKFLQDIIRDKRYWENKRQTVHQQEKELQTRIEKYEKEVRKLKEDREKIISKAKADAEELLAESNREIEKAIREIRENQAEKEATRKIRAELENFHEDVKDGSWEKGNGRRTALLSEIELQRKIEQIQKRKERHEKRKLEKEKQKAAQELRQQNRVGKEGADAPLAVGDKVHIKGLSAVGEIELIDGSMCTVIFGDMRTKLRLSRLERASRLYKANADGSNAPAPKTRADEIKENLQAAQISRITQDTIEDHRRDFHQDLDVRGMRGDEALNAVQYFIDDAILMGMSRVRILHGKGNGILRQLIRQYLGTIPNVTHYADEHVQFGGAGITVVDMG